MKEIKGIDKTRIVLYNMGMKAKITQDLYDKIKRDLLTASQVSIAQHYGVSQTTISQIAKSDSLLDYFTSGKEWHNKRLTDLIENSGVANLSGEPQFWAIHTTLKDVSNKLISARTGLSLNTIVKMKKAEDYEKYKNGSQQPSLNSKSLTQKNQKGRKTRVTGNEAIKAIIEEGLKKGVRKTVIARELNMTIATVNRILKRTDFSHRISLEDYERMKTDRNYLETRWPKTKKAFETTKNFYRFSLKNYCGIDKVSWWDGREKLSTLESEEIEKPAEPITVQDTGAQFEEMKQPEIEKVVEKEKEMEEPMIESKLVNISAELPERTIDELELEKFKYKGGFLLTGLVLVELFVLGLVLILK